MEQVLIENLEGQVEADSRLGKLYKRLCRTAHRPRSNDAICKSLAREYRSAASLWIQEHPVGYESPPSWLLPSTLTDDQDETVNDPAWPTLAHLTPRQRLQILFDLCFFQLVDVERFRSLAQFKDTTDGQKWRLSPAGPDQLGRRYWLIAGCWLYASEPNENLNDSTQDKVDGSPVHRRGLRKRQPSGTVSAKKGLKLLPDEIWKCLAWSVDSWNQVFNSQVNSKNRRGSERKLFFSMQEEWLPSAYNILHPWEHQQQVEIRRKEAELYRQALFESRKRSSRIAAQQKLKEQLAPDSSPITTRTLRNKNMVDHPKGDVNSSPTHKLTREERMARREKMAARRKVDAMMDRFLEAQQQSTSDHEKFEDYNNDEGDDATSSQSTIDDFSTNVENCGSHSPIKLLFKMGPNGPVRSELIIGDEKTSKNDQNAVDICKSSHIYKNCKENDDKDDHDGNCDNHNINNDNISNGNNDNISNDKNDNNNNNNIDMDMDQSLNNSNSQAVIAEKFAQNATTSTQTSAIVKDKEMAVISLLTLMHSEGDQTL